jgi:hypothetical protein
VLGEANLSGGQAAIATNGLGTGSTVVSAAYQGDLDFMSSNGSLVQTVN